VRRAIVVLCFLPRLAAAQASEDKSSDASDAAPAEPVPAPGKAAEPPPEPVAPASGFHWEPFGFLRMQYIAVQNDPNVAFVGRDDGFELQNARLGARGTLGTHAAFVISFDGAVDERTQVNVPQGKLAVGLRDAYVDVALSGKIVMRGGYWQTWVDPEALVPDTTREFVDHPLESRGMRATEGWQTPGLPPGRSIGAALRLDPEVPRGAPALGFELAAQNGSDEFSSNNDNDALALSASVIARFAHDGWLLAAARWNPRTVGMLPFRQDETDLQGSVAAHLAAGPISLSGGLIVQRTTFDTTGGPDQDAFGAHAQIMILIPGTLPLAVGYRFGILDPSSLITTDRVMEHTAGLVLGVPSYRMRLQLQLTHVDEQAERQLDNDRIQLAAEVAL
jgi:hypothetical protein